ncbi:dual specificity protein phosphatase 1 isoform X2 [Rhodamnia argentea]|uniref:protein-tyrosine-phosphatase n=1 Tax=Rhodamnia argentea TaxID=178133 RepID=A0ABM3HMC5_9MYRT|nr:dual specificity protein phosphatase 1 isoform X2 [Rhodamnia argentea]
MERIFVTITDLCNGRRMCQIEEGLFLGSNRGASNKDGLKSLNVTHILTVANLAPAFPNDFVYKEINVKDSEDTHIQQHFEECISFIDEARRQGGSILVHCYKGVSRSVTVVAAYLMKRRGMRLSQALEHIKTRRPQAAPNSGFMVQLQEFESSLNNATTISA